MSRELPPAASSLSIYAQAAIEHARDQHGIELAFDDLKQVDHILDLERYAGPLDTLDALALCYGTWFGENLVARHAGSWIGLDEPVAPRIRIDATYYSPIDAVRRRLTDSQSPSLQALVTSIESSRPTPVSRDQIRQTNLAAWNQLSEDHRFVDRSVEELTTEQAWEAIHPWIRSEGDLLGKKLLCLGAGGGLHAPLYAMVGMQVTVVDFSPSQLRIDQAIASRRQLPIKTICASLDDLHELEGSTFDVVLQPVNMNYLPDCRHVYVSIRKLTLPGSLYLVQHKNPVSLQTSAAPDDGNYRIAHPNDDGFRLVPSTQASPHRENETYEFIHSMSTLLGSLCQSGFVIEDFREPLRSDAWAPNGSFEHRSRFVSPYLQIKARRISMS